jgi:hypothetical protein
MKRFAIITKLFAACITTACLSTTVFAQTNNAMMRACRSDAQSHCPTVIPGGGRVAQCLKEHEAELTASCKAQLATILECSQQVKDICGAQATSPRGIRSCFAEHASKFSAACSSAGLSH